MYATTPLYLSKVESKIRALKGDSVLPVGAGISEITLSRSSSMLAPVFPDTSNISSLSMSNKVANSCLAPSTSALGRSILLITGMIFKPCSCDICRWAKVCASIPWLASTNKIAPSTAAKERDTS